MTSPLSLPKRLGRVLRREAPSLLHRGKVRALDFAFGRLGARSFADLGAVWAVEGGYTFHALTEHAIERAVLVDEDITPSVRRAAERHPQLSLVTGNFGDAAMPERVGDVDAVILFDVLLHQVSPDWDEVLAMYAPRVKYLIVSNPQLTAGGSTVRLTDLGRERYEQLVPADTYPADLFDRLDEPVPGRGRPWRDVHQIWQWGITDGDLVEATRRLGFELAYSDNLGRWRGLDDFEDHAFVFSA